ncbi:MAG: 30S ribosome-binding factor RbfA [Candidatus Omnitrophota bacterium]
MSLRMERVNNEIKKRIVEIIQEEIDDPNLGMLSITGVKTTSDLSESKVYFSVLNDDFPKAGKILNGMKAFIRINLGKKVRLKILPQLVFIPDDSIKYSVDIYQKIEEVKSAEEDSRNNK